MAIEIQTTKHEIDMENKILKSLTGKMTLVELANKMNFNKYKKEVFVALDQMVKDGKVKRSWDESGMTFYEKK